MSERYPPVPRYPAPDECRICGWYPAVPVRWITFVSVLLMYRYVRKTDRLCRSCGTARARRAQANCLGFGLWGIGFLGAIVAIFANAAELRSLHRACPPQARRPGVGTPRTVPLPRTPPVLLHVRSWLHFSPAAAGLIIYVLIHLPR